MKHADICTSSYIGNHSCCYCCCKHRCGWLPAFLADGRQCCFPESTMILITFPFTRLRRPQQQSADRAGRASFAAVSIATSVRADQSSGERRELPSFGMVGEGAWEVSKRGKSWDSGIRGWESFRGNHPLLRQSQHANSRWSPEMFASDAFNDAGNILQLAG